MLVPGHEHATLSEETVLEIVEVLLVLDPSDFQISQSATWTKLFQERLDLCMIKSVMLQRHTIVLQRSRSFAYHDLRGPCFC